MFQDAVRLAWLMCGNDSGELAHEQWVYLVERHSRVWARACWELAYHLSNLDPKALRAL